MSKQIEALKLALEALKQIDEAMPFPVAKFAQAAIREALAEQPAQPEPCDSCSGLGWVSSDSDAGTDQVCFDCDGTGYVPAQQQEPVAYDKTEINCFAQDLYDQKMREGKHGHHESMFHVIHQCIKKVSPPASKPLTDEQISDLWDGHTVPVFGKTGINPIVFARAIEAAHGIEGGA